jgi:hypothetical protein
MEDLVLNYFFSRLFNLFVFIIILYAIQYGLLKLRLFIINLDLKDYENLRKKKLQEGAKK